MGAGKKGYNAGMQAGINFQDMFGLDSVDADNLQCVKIFGADNVTEVEATYIGTGAIDTSKYNNFPKGSKITDLQAGAIYLKMDATTWQTVALA